MTPLINTVDFAGMSDAEAKKIQTILKRPPTLTEAMIWGIQGSEHCSYRSSKKHLRTLPIDAPNVLLGVGEDAGIVHFALDDKKRSYGVIMAHESRDVIAMGGRVVTLVDAVCLGALREDEVIHSYVPEHAEGWEFIIVGDSVDQESTYALFRLLRDQGDLDKVSLKDIGVGGIARVTMEQVEDARLGAEIDLSLIRTTYPDLSPAALACAETQERFCWVCDPSLTQQILNHYNKAGIRASLIGRVKEGNYTVRYGDEILVDVPASQIMEGVQYERSFSAPHRSLTEPEFAQPDLPGMLLKMLGSENNAGVKLLQPFRDRKEVPEIHQVGAALSVDSNPRYGKISPYWAGVNTVVEGMRNVAAIGATPWAVTDCLNFGNPEIPEQMWELVEGIRGIKEALKGVGHLTFHGEPVPVISGSVSLYNTASSSIIGTLGRINDTDNAVTMQFKEAGSKLYLLGLRKNELGGSEYYHQLGFLGANVPQPDFQQVKNELRSALDSINQGLVMACHSISDGGLAVTLAKMMAGDRGEGKFGFSIDLRKVSDSKEPLRPDILLFSETGGFVLEVHEDDASAFEAICRGRSIEPHWIGNTIKEPAFAVFQNARPLFSLPKELVITSNKRATP